MGEFSWALVAAVTGRRESPALEVIHLLQKAHRHLKIYDPLVPEESNASLEEVIRQNTVAVLTDHSAFKDIVGPRVMRWNRP